ncbi:MAG: hypothetical protein IPG99_15090 [Ignavibacteria bacterium]|nr:hypothetical protein [Ignavibacteria bacterium]
MNRLSKLTPQKLRTLGNNVVSSPPESDEITNFMVTSGRSEDGSKFIY